MKCKQSWVQKPLHSGKNSLRNWTLPSTLLFWIRSKRIFNHQWAILLPISFRNQKLAPKSEFFVHCAVQLLYKESSPETGLVLQDTQHPKWLDFLLKIFLAKVAKVHRNPRPQCNFSPINSPFSKFFYVITFDTVQSTICFEKKIWFRA